MFGPLIDTWLKHACGEPLERPRHRLPPPHLCNQAWRYSCECGTEWSVVGVDAVFRDRQWQAPFRECSACRRWVEGRP